MHFATRFLSRAVLALAAAALLAGAALAGAPQHNLGESGPLLHGRGPVAYFSERAPRVGKKPDGDPQRWRIVGGGPFLNLDADVQQMWLKDIPGNVRTADARWPEIRAKRAAELE